MKLRVDLTVPNPSVGSTVPSATMAAALRAPSLCLPGTNERQQKNVTRTSPLTHGPDGVMCSLASPIIVVYALGGRRRGSLTERSVVFALPPIPNFRFPLRVVEIGGVMTDLLVWGVRRDFSFVWRYLDHRYRSHQLQENALTCNTILISRS